MPWSNQSGPKGGKGGGPNGGPNGGPWGSGGNDGGSGGPNGGPWGGGGPKRSGGGKPPDLEDLFKMGQDKFKNAMPGGGGAFSGGIVFLILFIAAILYLFKAVYTIQADELGVELRFGKPKDEISEPGIHFHFWPIETYEVANVRQNRSVIGQVGRSGSNSGLMLSGDQNIVDLVFAVLYQVSDPRAYLFNVKDPDEMVRKVAESAMREIVGRRPAQDVFRDDRAGVSDQVRTIIQATLNNYHTGVQIKGVLIEDVAPPADVANAFDEVQRAEQDEDRFIEEANRHANRILGAARGEAAQIREDAAAYKNQVVEEAKGEAQRFISVYDEYRKAPEVTRKRLYFETMEKVLSGSQKVIVEQGGGSGVVPYLPLPEIQKRNRSTTAQGEAQ